MSTPSSPRPRRAFLAATGLTITGTLMATLRGDDVSTPPRWYGIFVPGRDLTLLDQVTQPLELPPSVGAYFVKLDSDFTLQTLKNFEARGLIPFLTLEPWGWQNKPFEMVPDLSLKALTSGRYDQDLRRIADVIASYGKPVYLRLAHEMNGHWYPWAVGQNGNTAQDYIDFWRHVRTIFTKARRIRWVWACASTTNQRTGAPDIATLWPGDDLVHYAGTTGYGWDKDAAATYDRTFTKLATITRRGFLIPEMGAQNGLNAVGTPGAAWTESLGPYLNRNQRIRGFVWFHIGPDQGATGDYRLGQSDTYTALNSVLRQII